jgi:hypothetical protein
MIVPRLMGAQSQKLNPRYIRSGLHCQEILYAQP